MNEFEVGKAYVFIGFPMPWRGVVARQDMRYVWLTADSAEYLPDAPDPANITGYLTANKIGLLWGTETFIPKDSLVCGGRWPKGDPK